jgi:hypothetical protein
MAFVNTMNGFKLFFFFFFLPFSSSFSVILI